MTDARDERRKRQRDAVWTWTWLGLRDSTPAFKASLVLLGMAVVYIAVRALGA